MQSDHSLEKLFSSKINKQKIFVHELYLKTTKLGCWFIASNTQKCGKLEV